MSKAKARARNQAYQRQFNLPDDEVLVDGQGTAPATPPSCPCRKGGHVLIPLCLLGRSSLSEFNCALQQKILLQGKLYISQNFACFYANIFGNETIVSAAHTEQAWRLRL